MARHNGMQQAEAELRPPEGSRHAASGDADTGASGKEPAQPGAELVHLTDDGYLELLLAPGMAVTGSMAANIAAEIIRLAGSGTMPLLLVLSGVESISRGARDVFSNARSLSAVAVLGVSPVDRVIANFLLGGDIQPCPTRYFSLEDSARSWLTRFVA